MRFFSKKVLIVFILVLLFLGAGVFVSLYKKSQEILTEPAEKLESPRYKVIGESVQGRKIEGYTYGNGENSILFVGGVHGGYEWNSVLLAYRLIDYLKENSVAIPDDLTVSIIPSLNPDGVHAVTLKDGRFVEGDVSTNKTVLASGRFNAHEVDLNRNFDCKWKPTSKWQTRIVSAGGAPFSEPETQALRNFVLESKPKVVVFWHSQSNAVYASECQNGILPQTIDILNAYSNASGYPAIKSFGAYEITGDAEGWLASINIPAITVELKTHDTIEWERNLSGIKAIFEYYSETNF